MKSIKDRLTHPKPILLDGAMGTRLLEQGVDVSLPLWSASVLDSDPLKVLTIHREYIEAGSDVITANTFRTTTRTYKKITPDIKSADAQAKKALNNAIDLAKQARGNTNVWIAGSIAPLEDCYSPELFPGVSEAKIEFTEAGSWLEETGVDILLMETMNSITEAKVCLDANKNRKCSNWISFILKDSQTLLNGDRLQDAVHMAHDHGAEAILINCTELFHSIQAIETIMTCSPLPAGLYPNLGKDMPSPNGEIGEKYTVSEFSKFMKHSLDLGIKIIGSCCGSSPQHIQELKLLTQHL